jgi:hypothetical protein
MTPQRILRYLSGRLARLTYGGDVVAKHKINRQLTIHHLTNPFSIYFSFSSETNACTLSAAEARKVAGLLEKIVETEYPGAPK